MPTPVNPNAVYEWLLYEDGCIDAINANHEIVSSFCPNNAKDHTPTHQDIKSRLLASTAGGFRIEVANRLRAWKRQMIEEGSKEFRVFIGLGGSRCEGWLNGTEKFLPVTECNVDIVYQVCRNPQLLKLFLFVTFGEDPQKLMLPTE